MRSRLRAEHRAQGCDRRRIVELIRVRRHQRLADLPSLQRLISLRGVDARAPLVTEVPVTGASLRTLASVQPERYPVFLDSAALGPLARFSVLAAAPSAAMFRDAQGDLIGQGVTPGAGGFLDNLESWFRRDAAPRGAHPKTSPFLGGWIVYLGYEVAAEIEPRLRLPSA